MKLIGMMSTYLEGRLARGAVRSILACELDHLYVYEGPAGDPLDADVPETDLGDLLRIQALQNVTMRENRWRTDARKRNEMLQQAKRDHPEPGTWAIILDGDELLVNGEYLRDRLQAILWADAVEGDRTEGMHSPTARMPLRLVEREGSLSLITARAIRLDLVRSIDHSSSVITNEQGVQEGWGNYPELSPLYLEGLLHAIDRGNLAQWPPFSCEPHIVHRSHLRHPLRRGLRMSDQEAVEFAKAQRAENG